MASNQQPVYVEIPGNEYGNVIILEEYKGMWSLCLGRKVKDGKYAGNVYKEWCYPEFNDGAEKRPRGRSVPWKIELGTSKELALNSLRLIAQNLT